MRKDVTTKTFVITATPNVMMVFEKFLAFFHHNAGHSGIFGMEFDGDGSDYMLVDPPPQTKYIREAHIIGNCIGDGVEIARESSYWAIPFDRHKRHYQIKDGFLNRYDYQSDTYERIRNAGGE